VVIIRLWCNIFQRSSNIAALCACAESGGIIQLWCNICQRSKKNSCIVRMRIGSWGYNSALVQYLAEEFKEGEVDKMTLKKCVKTTTGLLCYLDVEIYTRNEKYLTYIPVNYNGVQILLPEKKILAKSAGDIYGLLSCRDEEEELVNEVTMEIKHFSRISAWDEKKERKRR
jgi:hypothetical protein